MKRRYYLAISILVIFTVALIACSSMQTAKSEGGSSAQSAASQQVSSNTGETKAGTKEGSIKAASASQKLELTDIRFDYNKYDIKTDDKKTLSSYAEYLLKNKKTKIVIEGNCDERGSSAYNMRLGERRANAAKELLVKSGVSVKRIKTISYGKERPLDPGHNEDAWAKNRRDHFILN